MSANMTMRLTGIQLAVLTILHEAKEPVTLTELEKRVYRKSGKVKPKTARQAIAACIRTLDKKMHQLKVTIDRKTPIGRGHEASYAIKGKVENLTAVLEDHK